MAAFKFERNESKGLVSVVMPTYRAERYVGEALDAVGCQTFPHWELIVVEDGSDDGTRAIVEDFARKHPGRHVEYLRNPQNRGCGYTRNLTFARAGGEFLALLDADDRWLPDYLTAMVDALRSSGKDVAYSSTLMIEDETDLPLGVWGPGANDLADFPQSLFGRSFLTPSATVLRRSVVADVGSWDAELHYCDDFSYWLRCVAAGKQFQHVGGCHCLYRKNHPTATTRRLCATLEEVATVAEQYVDMPFMRPRECRRYASNSYWLAARMHATSDPGFDPSADASRAPRLWFKAWQLWPRRVDYLLRSGLLGAVEMVRRRRPSSHSASGSEESAARIAA